MLNFSSPLSEDNAVGVRFQSYKIIVAEESAALPVQKPKLIQQEDKAVSKQ